MQWLLQWFHPEETVRAHYTKWALWAWGLGMALLYLVIRYLEGPGDLSVYWPAKVDLVATFILLSLFLSRHLSIERCLLCVVGVPGMLIGLRFASGKPLDAWALGVSLLMAAVYTFVTWWEHRKWLRTQDKALKLLEKSETLLRSEESSVGVVSKEGD